MIVRRIIEQRLSTNILSISKLSGGDINEVYSFKTHQGAFVVKVNDKNRFPKMLRKEAQGLDLLAKANVSTPKLIDQFEQEDLQFIILEYITQEASGKKYWLRFGEDLSRLHQKSASNFGLEYDNYIGSLPQENKIKTSWEHFFIECRINPLVKMGFDKGLLHEGHLQKFQNFFKLFNDLIPTEKPSLLHGDLWSGNLLCGEGQIPVFIDPAVYYGHREVDIAMTKMFGGFDPIFLSRYNEVFPLEKGWENRLNIHNLYPILVHLNLFGKSYLGGIEKVLEKM